MNYSQYQVYIDSGVAWIGFVPSSWTIKKIKWDTPVLRGASPRPIDDPVYFDDDGEYAWVRISDVTASNIYLEKTEQKLSELGASLSVKLEPDELFLSIAGSVGKPCITKIKCCIHDGFVWFPRLKLNKKFLYYIFASGEPYKGLGKLGTQLNLNTETVGSIFIPIPSKDEQQSITNFLDKEIAHVDLLLEKKKQLIQKLNEKRIAIIHQAVTKGLKSDIKLKESGSQWLGLVPEDWEVKKIKWDSAVQRGASPRPIDDPIYFDDDGEYAWVRISDVTASNIYLEKTEQKLSELGASLSVKLEPGELFLSIAGSVGKPCITKIKCCIHDGFVWFPYLTINPKFLYYVFVCGEPYKGLGKMGTQLNLNTETVGSISIAVPSSELQLTIVDYLDSNVTKIDNLIINIEKAIEKLHEYKTTIITAGVTGKILVQKSEQKNLISEIKLNTRKGSITIDPDMILYLQAEGNYTEVFLADQTKYIITRDLGSFESILNKNVFFRLGRSLIINKNYVTIKKKDSCIIQYGKEKKIKELVAV